MIGYQAAVDVLTNTSSISSKNPSAWQTRLPDTPDAAGIMAVLGYRPSALFTDGAEARPLPEGDLRLLHVSPRTELYTRW